MTRDEIIDEIVELVTTKHNKVVVIVSDRFRRADDEMMEIVRRAMRKDLPFQLQASRRNRWTMRFNTECEIVSMRAEGEGWRGLGISYMWVTDDVRDRDRHLILETTYPVIMSGKAGKIVMSERLDLMFQVAERV